MTIEHVDLDVDSGCDVLLNSFSDPLCLPASTVALTTLEVNDDANSAASSIVGPLEGTISVAVIIIVVVIITLQIFKNRRQLKKHLPRSVYSLSLIHI